MLVEHCHEQAGKRALRSIKSVLATLDRQLAALDQNVDDHLDWYFKDQRTPPPCALRQ